MGRQTSGQPVHQGLNPLHAVTGKGSQPVAACLQPGVPSCPTPLGRSLWMYNFPDRRVCLTENTEQMKEAKGKANPTPAPWHRSPRWGASSLSTCRRAIPGRAQVSLRDVPLPWWPVDVPHDALHHPLDALAHSFAREGGAGLGQAVSPANLAGAVTERSLDVGD